MFRIQSLAIVAALFGNASVASAAGCCSTYTAGGSYTSGDVVSASTTTTESNKESCVVGSSGCDADGFKTVTTTTTETYNYECTENANSVYCSNSAYAPNGVHGTIAWNKVGTAECSGTDTSSCTSSTIPDAWSGVGCPAAFASGTDYDAADIVSVNKGSYGLVYQCRSEPTNLYCGQDGYAPGTDQYWSTAWDSLGSCTGTVAPTTSPVNDVLTGQGGCPSAFDSGADYEEGDKVAKDGLVYQCKSWPSGMHCSQEGYEPGTSIGAGTQIIEYWKEAWTVVGTCSGTIAPTASPDFVALADMGGCPDTWSVRSNVNPYEEGDVVSSGKIVYRCKAFPFSGHCGQAGYEPGIDGTEPVAWKDAWTVAGFCDGSIGPTASPSFDVLAVGACPNEWVAGDNVSYEEGDMVAVTVSESPIRKVAYKCKAWPYSGYCGQFSPTQFGGDQGWTLVGGCDGSMAPTSSPSFDSLTEAGDGCPQDWSLSTSDYEAGDMVALTVSTTPERKIVYKCRDWPNSGYCGQGSGFKPGSKNGYMAWDQVGFCDGTKAPTASPVAYTGTCQYDKCRMVDTTVVCTPGSTGCSCTAGQTQTASCTKDVEEEQCTSTDVVPWSSSQDYLSDDVVRKGLKRFKCRAWPRYFWCRQDVYKPTLSDSGLWKEAWTEDGMCTVSTLLA